MVVDDTPQDSQKISVMLRDLGYDVAKTCRTGADAVVQYPVVKPDLVTMDIAMPDMDGIQATKAILAFDPSARVIMVTTHGQEPMMLEALDAGAKGYVLKPFKAERLDAIIRRVMAHTLARPDR